MPRALTQAQIDTLVMIGADRIMLTPITRDIQRLRQHDLVRETVVGTCITAAGLRALADAMDRGQLPDAIERHAQRKAAKASE